MNEYTNKERYLNEVVRSIDIKILIGIYLLLRPNVTQLDIAKRLHVGQVTVSRILNREKNEIKPEWIPAVFEMLQEIKPDLENLGCNISMIDRAADQISNLCRTEQIAQIAQVYYSDSFGCTPQICGIICDKDLCSVQQGFTLHIPEKDTLIEFRDIERIKEATEQDVYNGSGYTDWIVSLYRIIPIHAKNVVLYTTNRYEFYNIPNYYELSLKYMQHLRPVTQGVSAREFQHSVILIDRDSNMVKDEIMLRLCEK